MECAMAQFESYPVIRTSNFARTVAFYEDLFGLVPFYETDGFVRLKHAASGEMALTIIDVNHKFLPEGLLNNKEGQIMSFVVDQFDQTYEYIYMEGLTILKEPEGYGEGGRHFMAADPYNSVVINIVAPETKTKAESDLTDGHRECACC